MKFFASLYYPVLSGFLAVLFPRPHTVERLECCAIISSSNVVPSHSKACFLFVVIEGKKQNKTTKAGPLQQGAKELAHWEMKPQELTGGLEEAISCNKVSFIQRQNAHRVRKEISLYKMARAEQKQHVWKLNIYQWVGNTNLLSFEWLEGDFMFLIYTSGRWYLIVGLGVEKSMVN